MKVIIDLCVVPIGVGTSVSKYIAMCHQILKKYPVKCNLHAYGTNIEGEWNDVFDAVKECHEKIHKNGVPRITTTIKLGTRIDKKQSMQNKIDSVNEKLKISD